MHCASCCRCSLLVCLLECPCPACHVSSSCLPRVLVLLATYPHHARHVSSSCLPVCPHHAWQCSHNAWQWSAQVPAKEDKHKNTVTADPAQTHCGVSGEKFEIYWDDDLEEWRYKSAVKVDLAQARRYASCARGSCCEAKACDCTVVRRVWTSHPPPRDCVGA